MKFNRVTLLAALFAALLAGIAFHGYWDKHWESRRAEAAREVLVSGDWLVPTLNGNPFVTKPPLMYWTVAAFFKATGSVTDTMSRLPSVLVTLGAVGLFISMARRWRKPDGTPQCDPLEAGVIFATLPMVYSIGTSAETEPYLLFFTCLTLWGYLWIEPGGDRKANLKYRAAFALGLVGGFMIKGPLGWIFPLLGVFAHEYSCEKSERRLAWVDLLFFAAAHALLAAPWFIEVYRTVPIATKVWFNETVRRVGDDTFQTHRQPFWYYLPGVLIHLPWLVLLPGALKKVAGEKTAKSIWPLTWFILGLLTLSIATSKRHHYGLSFTPGIALALAAGITRLKNEGGWEKIFGILKIFGLALPVLGLAGMAALGVKGALPIDGATLVALLGAGAFGWFVLTKRLADPVTLCGAGLLTAYLIITAGFVPAVDGFRSPAAFYEKVKAVVPGNESIVNWREERFAASFYLDRIVKIAKRPEDLEKLLPQGGWLVWEAVPDKLMPPDSKEVLRHESADPFNQSNKTVWILARYQPNKKL